MDPNEQPAEEATPAEEPIVGTLGVHLTLRGSGPRPTLDDVRIALAGLDVGEGVVVKVTEIEWR